MNEQKRHPQLTPEDVERIMKLPKRHIRLGNDTKSGYFDEQEHLLYQCDQDGKLTGKVLTIKQSASPPPPPTVQHEEKTEDPPEKDDGKTPIQRAISKIPKPALIAVCALVVVVAGAAAILPFLGGNNSTIDQPNIPMIEDPNVMEEISVIRTTRDLIPGQQISLADLEEIKIEGATFQQFSMFDRDLCQWDKADQLVGGYASEYMPSGHYIELNDIISRAPSSTTPWESIEGTKIRLAMDAVALTDRYVTFGHQVDLTVQKVINNQVAAGTEEGDAAATTTIDEITRTEEYNLPQLTVVDVLNADGQSIYSSYVAYAGIPLSERRDYLSAMMWGNPELQTKLTPAQVILNVEAAQADVLSAIGSLNSENITTALRGTDRTVETSVEMSQCIADFEGVRLSINSAISYNEQLAAEEEAARQQAIEEALKNQEKK